MLSCCRCCSTAATAVFAGANSAEVPQGHARELLSVCLQKQPDEGGHKEGARLGDAGRHWLQRELFVCGVHMPGGRLGTHCSCREALQSHRHHQGAVKQQEAAAPSGMAGRTTAVASSGCSETAGGSMSNSPAPGSLQANWRLMAAQTTSRPLEQQQQAGQQQRQQDSCCSRGICQMAIHLQQAAV